MIENHELILFLHLSSLIFIQSGFKKIADHLHCPFSVSELYGTKAGKLLVFRR